MPKPDEGVWPSTQATVVSTARPSRARQKCSTARPTQVGDRMTVCGAQTPRLPLVQGVES